MANVSEILENKRRTQVVTISPEASVFDAIKLMAENEIGALMVIDDGALLGIVTERDYARKIILEGRSSKKTQVKAIMRQNIPCVSPDATVDQCRKIMTNEAVRYLPVVQVERLVGLVSLGDIVSFMIAEKDYLIDQLTNYITGSRGSIRYTE